MINVHSNIEITATTHLIFGQGDILVGLSSPFNTKEVSVTFAKSKTKHPIGATTFEKMPPTVIMSFDNPDSVDVVMEKLIEVKKLLTQ